MMIGVVLPVGYMMFRNKRVPSSSSYSKQTFENTLVRYLLKDSCLFPSIEWMNPIVNSYFRQLSGRHEFELRTCEVA
ncbi:hypothetical protein GBA52_015937 [Prunus armeniaca]|nr:hypothetical protein GBA52_015937 [Prunus armeniaca]